MRQLALGELFTEEELEKAASIRDECAAGEFARRFASEVVEPVLGRINEATGQQNDARYLAYMVEHALGSTSSPLR